MSTNRRIRRADERDQSSRVTYYICTHHIRRYRRNGKVDHMALSILDLLIKGRTNGGRLA